MFRRKGEREVTKRKGKLKRGSRGSHRGSQIKSEERGKQKEEQGNRIWFNAIKF